MSHDFNFLVRPCPTDCPWLNSTDCELCDEKERFIRHYIHGPAVCQMDDYERSFCLIEANRCGEGMFNTAELDQMSDQELAKSVMTAWRAYVYSNCM